MASIGNGRVSSRVCASAARSPNTRAVPISNAHSETHAASAIKVTPSTSPIIMVFLPFVEPVWSR
jgi:hypothetical protein